MKKENVKKAEELLKKIKELNDHLEKIEPCGNIYIGYGGWGYDPAGSKYDNMEILSKNYINYKEVVDNYKAKIKKDIDKCKLELEKL